MWEALRLKLQSTQNYSDQSQLLVNLPQTTNWFDAFVNNYSERYAYIIVTYKNYSQVNCWIFETSIKIKIKLPEHVWCEEIYRAVRWGLIILHWNVRRFQAIFRVWRWEANIYVRWRETNINVWRWEAFCCAICDTKDTWIWRGALLRKILSKINIPAEVLNLYL